MVMENETKKKDLVGISDMGTEPKWEVKNDT